MERKIETSRKSWIIFLAVAFAVPYLMGIPLWLCYQGGLSTVVFPNAQMFYPAAAAMLAMLLGGAAQPNMPKRFFWFHIACTAAMLAVALASALVPGQWAGICNLVLIGASLIFWVVLLTERKEKREAYGLRWHGGILKPVGLILLFIVLRLGMMFITFAMYGSLGDYLSYWATSTPWIGMLYQIPNFFLVVIAFFGEEYGWRYYLQPRLQQRFGLRGGVLLLGLVWGLWHLPLNLFYYSPETSLQSIVTQIIVCLSLAVFFAFAYLKTGNIWVPVILHFLNNNLPAATMGTADLYSNQVLTWGSVLQSAALYLILFLPFLLSKVFRKPPAEQQ